MNSKISIVLTGISESIKKILVDCKLIKYNLPSSFLVTFDKFIPSVTRTILLQYSQLH